MTYKLLINSIIYFESSGRLINIKYKEGNGKFYGKLSNIEKQLKRWENTFFKNSSVIFGKL